MNKTKIFINPHASVTIDNFPVGNEAFEFHKKLPGYNMSPLINASTIAAALQVEKVWVKDESSRFGLPAFKILGASYAIYKVLIKRLGKEISPWNTFDDLKKFFESLKPLTFIAATDGNYGRAVARMAKLLGFSSHIFVPKGTVPVRIDAIKNEGAKVTIVDGTYDDCVIEAKEIASDKNIVISDTAWEGYMEIPLWIMEGYTTILKELDIQLAEKGFPQVDVVTAQMGVGGLATGIVWHYKRPDRIHKPKIVGVESLIADCVLESVKKGYIVAVPGPHTSIMAGLNCGVMSTVSLPILSKGIDVFVAIDDNFTKEAMRKLANTGIVSGETGASGLAGLLALLQGENKDRNRQLLGITEKSHIVILSTEGANDPVAYEKIVGKSSNYMDFMLH